jgi:hypothetical protein
LKAYIILNIMLLCPDITPEIGVPLISETPIKDRGRLCEELLVRYLRNPNIGTLIPWETPISRIQ